MRETQRQVFQVIVKIMIWIKIIISQKFANGIECPATSRCGSLSIPIPFATSPNCAFDENFLINCNTTTGKAFLNGENDLNILSISLEDHELRVSSSITKVCFPKHSTDSYFGKTRVRGGMSMLSNYFNIGGTQNQLVVVGCNINGFFFNDQISQDPSREPSSFDQCESGCSPRMENVKNGTCDPLAGCCQKPIPFEAASRDYKFLFFFRAGINGSSSTKCGYAFVAETDAYKFSSLDLQQGIQNPDTIPVVIEWAVANYNSCQEAQAELSTTNTTEPYACKAKNSECYNIGATGYRCKCRKGYQGNPYLLDGCQDVNECESDITNSCVSSAKCINQPGSFICACPKGSRGNGKKNETGCSNQHLQLIIALSVCIGILMLLVLGFWIYWGLNKRKLAKLKKKFFKQNGGILLQKLLSDHKQPIELIKIFTSEELKKATDNFEEGRVLGEGANGRVYKGLLQGKKMVAIKKSKVCDRSQIQQFINESIVLSQINHRNVVKLLGCCLETEVPVLVSEFITNGTLYSHLQQSSSKLSWQTRLKIAKEVAGALAYLHIGVCIPIIHRDVKSSNILLDDDFTARISDFGSSRLIPLGQTQVITLMEGTYGYLDPEYFSSGKLTEKSDVYGFGVVLAELLTGKEALFDNSGSRTCLAAYLISSVTEDCLVEILDDKMEVDKQSIVLLKEVANLSVMCLNERGEERPTMKEVQAELEEIIEHI